MFGIDLDGDGDNDVVSASTIDDTIAWYENLDGSGGSWSYHEIYTAADEARSVFAIDLDGDGDIDVLSASTIDDTIAWSENLDGSGGSWSYHEIYTAADGAASVFGIDVDGDGDIDVLSASAGDDTIAWYENLDGSGGSWSYHEIYTAADYVWSVFGIDLDGDGDVDVLSASENDDTIAWYVTLPSCVKEWRWILRASLNRTRTHSEKELTPTTVLVSGTTTSRQRPRRRPRRRYPRGQRRPHTQRPCRRIAPRRCASQPAAAGRSCVASKRAKHGIQAPTT